MIQTWTDVTTSALLNLWQGFLSFTTQFIIAIIVFIIGWFISVGVGKLIAEILRKLKFNQIFEKGVWKEALKKAGFKIDASGFIGAIGKWTLVIFFLWFVTAEILKWTEFAGFLESILAYLPNVIIAALIFAVAVVIADITEKIVRAAVESARVGYGHLVGAIAKWSIWIFAILAILDQLKIQAADWIFELIKITFLGIVAMAAIAFGLGGKEAAAELIEDLKKKISEK